MPENKHSLIPTVLLKYKAIVLGVVFAGLGIVFILLGWQYERTPLVFLTHLGSALLAVGVIVVANEYFSRRDVIELLAKTREEITDLIDGKLRIARLCQVGIRDGRLEPDADYAEKLIKGAKALNILVRTGPKLLAGCLDEIQSVLADGGTVTVVLSDPQSPFLRLAEEEEGKEAGSLGSEVALSTRLLTQAHVRAQSNGTLTIYHTSLIIGTSLIIRDEKTIHAALYVWVGGVIKRPSLSLLDPCAGSRSFLEPMRNHFEHVVSDTDHTKRVYPLEASPAPAGGPPAAPSTPVA
jgi:hypothetical protein